MTKICTYCKKNFYIKPSDHRRGRGQFCGKSCARSGTNNPAYKHGQSHRSGMTKEYRTWAGIKQRVSNPNRDCSPYYKEKGVTMCDEWFNSFEQFFSDMGKAPTPKHSIDRIDPYGNYEPSNCRWATHTEQMNNLRK